MSTENLTFDVELPPSAEPVTKQALFSYASLSTLLRVLGAGVLITSVSIFLFKGWGDGNDLDRYVLLLIHTLLLAVTGVIVGVWVKESKGARLFLGLSLVSTVVNFAVLGGMIYSTLQWDGVLGRYPSFATWQAQSFTEAIATTAVAWCLLLPVAWFSFMALARRSALRLTGLFLLSSTALLLPMRQSELVVALVAGLSIVLLIGLIKAKKADPSLTTLEGRFARLVIFSGPVILVGRGMYLYSIDTLMITVLGGLGFIAMRQLTFDSSLSVKARKGLNAVSLLPALVVAAGAASTVVNSVWATDMAWLPSFGLILGGLLVEVSIRDWDGGTVYRRMGSLVVVVTMLSNLALFPGTLTSVMCILTGAFVMTYGFSSEQRIDFMVGLMTLVAGVGYQCILAFETFDLGSWSALAIIGILTIVAGSVLERHGAIIRARVGNWQKSFRKWQY